jgi:ubiquinone/menaquinone biosynthesis C-methylase UbiE
MIMNTDTHHFDERAEHWDENPRIVARAEAVAEGIRAHVPLNTTMTAFEYGCGTGLVSFHLQPDLGRIVLADTSSGMLDVLKRKIQAADVTNMMPLQLDLLEDPLPEERFDLIYTGNTLHHIADVDTILQKFHTLLQPGGWLCIADLDKEDGSFHGKGFHGHHGFDRSALQRQLTQTGFSDISVSTCFTMQRELDDGTMRDFSIFLMIGRT